MLPFSSSPKHNRCHPWISEFIVANLESKTFGWNLMCSKSCASEIYSFLKVQLVLGSKKVCLQNHREKRWFRDDMIIWGPALLFSNFDQPSPSCWKTWEETAMEDRALRSWRRRAATRRTTLTRFSLSRHLSGGLMVSWIVFLVSVTFFPFWQGHCLLQFLLGDHQQISLGCEIVSCIIDDRFVVVWKNVLIDQWNKSLSSITTPYDPWR